MEATNNATVKSTFYHPQHLLSSFQYSGTGSSIYACAVCELRVTGTGYRCESCDFNIHESCFRLPQSHSAADRHPHELTLTRLDASQRCDLCKETSHVGRYLYCCAPCNYAIHPRCTTLLANAQPQGERRRVNNGTLCFMLNCASRVLAVCHAVDILFGNMLAPVIEPLKAAVDEMLHNRD
ncbi:hypothetical protein PR202_ga29222 [Eleusine coracana subsp. coracana]|uniref:Phorbol-ester/DAG-type domain-containing protein n=1 Tax=Eleusine coracana subsp. coracana TaxID=191504 RepID=A0AAV5DL33_ELECO|nr:hypothetical protein QOZ80_7AG0576700 [Eleusine coracana subsp. coracana]GJN11059.1 hypothetical protein PR202_ga29222 [Eleusine coracana subsp. coracana]